jgi:hypothetical protein
VPIGEGLRLWAELAERSAEDGTMPHKFLYFPDENHWVLKPQHAKIRYQVVEAFLDTTVHGKAWEVPDLLRRVLRRCPQAAAAVVAAPARGASRNAPR